MWVKCIKMCFLEFTVRKISDCYLKLPEGQTPLVPHFAWILLTDFEKKKNM